MTNGDELKIAQDALIADQNKARDELKIAQDTLEANMEIAQENLKVAQEGQITERFTRAINQLGAIDKDGNPAMEIRLGGIYALERIANESEKDYWPIMEILTAYVRKNSPAEHKLKRDYLTSEPISMDIQANESTISKDSTTREISLDIQAILTIIGKCNHYYDDEEPRLNLHLTYLEGAYLTDAHLERVSFYGAHLKRALLDDAHLEGAYLADAFLEGAILDGAYLEGAYLKNAHLKVAYLRNAHLEGAYLEGSNLEYAYLEGANLEYTYLLNTHLEGAYLGYANLKGAKYLKIDQLSKAQTLYKAQLDPELEDELKEKYPDLFKETYVIGFRSVY